MKKILFISFLSLASFYTSAAGCTKEQAKEAVEKMCGEVSSKGDASKAEVTKFRFCDTNYVWIQDSDVKMVVHPIKGRLNGKDLKGNKDEKGKFLFVEFDKVAKANKDGGWVDYYWTKPGDEAPTPKISFVKLCAGDKKWIAGAGVWK